MKMNQNKAKKIEHDFKRLKAFLQKGLTINIWILSNFSMNVEVAEEFCEEFNIDYGMLKDKAAKGSVGKNLVSEVGGIAKDECDWFDLGSSLGMLIYFSSNLLAQDMPKIKLYLDLAKYQFVSSLKELGASFEEIEIVETTIKSFENCSSDIEKRIHSEKIEILILELLKKIVEEKQFENQSETIIEKGQIEELIVKNRFQEVFILLDRFLSDPTLVEDLVMNWGRYNRVTSQVRRGIISYSDSQLEINRIRSNLFQILSDC